MYMYMYALCAYAKKGYINVKTWIRWIPCTGPQREGRKRNLHLHLPHLHERGCEHESCEDWELEYSVLHMQDDDLPERCDKHQPL